MGKFKLQIVVSIVFLLLAQWLAMVSIAVAQTPLYEGKNILLVSGTDAGGAGDLRTRAVIPVLKKHIPGHPNIVVQYMPGAGGRKAANHMYKSVRPDGLTIGAMLTGMVQGTIFGETDVLYELDKFIYLGSHARYAPYAFLTRKAAGFNTREKLTASRNVRIGAPAVGPQSLHHGPAVHLHVGHERDAFCHRLYAAGNRLRLGKKRNRCPGQHYGQLADAQCALVG
jgi:tripartite-type tricarboxylate transporter receptor subunit TctC